MAKYVKDILRDGSPFAIEYMMGTTNNSMADMHQHTHYELYYQLSGERYYFIKDRTFYIKKGNIVLVNVDEIHKTNHANPNRYERILVHFQEEFISDMCSTMKDIDLLEVFKKGSRVLKTNAKEQHYLETLFTRMLEEQHKGERGFVTCSKILLIELLIFVVRHSENVEFHSTEYPSALHVRISKVSKYINDHFHEEVELATLSEHFHMSPYYLSRSFKQVTGFTFTEYLNTVRIKEAKTLLKGTRLSIIEIALRVGYQNPTHFGRVFKTITGLTPLKYRNQ